MAKIDIEKLEESLFKNTEEAVNVQSIRIDRLNLICLQAFNQERVDAFEASEKAAKETLEKYAQVCPRCLNLTFSDRVLGRY